MIIDPLTGKAIPNPAFVDPVPSESATPDPVASPSRTSTP
jgi:hypothetical protein